MSTISVSEGVASETTAVDRKLRPVLWWAGIGSAILAVEIYTLASWVINGHAKRVPIGDSVPPDYMIFWARFQEIVLPLGALLVIYFIVIRPRVRSGSFTAYGLFILTAAILWWQDPLVSYVAHSFTYSSVYFNLGSWAADVPGWNAPYGEQLSFPLLWGFGVYVMFFGGGSVLICALMKRARKRWPRLGRVGLLASTCLIMITAAALIESTWNRMGTHTFAGAIDGLTLFKGQYYQYPIYEAILVGLLWTTWAAVLYFRDEFGRTVPERGIDDVHVNPRLKTFLRFLAIYGSANIIFLFVYFLPFNVTAVHGSEWPKDIQDRSYFTTGICGPNTDYACPGPGVPIPRESDSLHVDPQGTLSGPGATPSRVSGSNPPPAA